MPAVAAPPGPPAVPPPAPNLSGSAPAKGAPAPGPSAMDQAMTDLGNMADMDDESPDGQKPPAKPPAKTPPKTPPKQTAKPVEKPPAKTDVKPPKEAEQEQEQPEDPEQQLDKPDENQPDQKKGQRIKPWDLLDKFKGKALTLEKENAELKARLNGHEIPKEALDKITTLETRNKELEDEIRFTNYEKSKEYQEQYHKPYLEAWNRAVGELSELTITDSTGHTRQGGTQDLLLLAKMPLGQARKYANELFGDAADDVIHHRRIVRELAEKQHKALEDARQNGGEREKQQLLERQAKENATAESIGKAWQTINSEATAKYEFLRPVEGQQERNAKLEQAVKFVDETMELNLNNAKTEQERENILRRHSALRNRAIGFAVLKFENKALKAEMEELKKTLAEFQGSEPTPGEQGHDPGSSMITDPMEAAMHGLAQLAE